MALNVKETTPSDQVTNLVTDLGGKVFHTGKNIAASQVNKALDYFVPGLDQMTNTQAKEVLKNTAVKVNAVLQDLAKDPEVQQLILESGEAFGQLTSELIGAIEEPVAEIAERGLNMVGEIAQNSGRTLTKTGVDLVMSILGEIPGVGGLVDLGVTGLVAFNGLAKNVMIASDNVEKMATVANHLTGNALVPIQDSLKVFSDLEQRATGVVSNINRKLDSLNQLQTPKSTLPQLQTNQPRINLSIREDPNKKKEMRFTPPSPSRTDPNFRQRTRNIHSRSPSPFKRQPTRRVRKQSNNNRTFKNKYARR